MGAISNIKENFKNNKQTWWLIIAIVVFIILVFVIPRIPGIDKGPCPAGVLYNRDTGQLCPEEAQPAIDPALMIPGKG